MTVFWIIAGLLAAAMFMAGVVKLIKTKDELYAMQMHWVEDYSDSQVKLLGAAEAIGAVGIIVPAATGIVPILTPIAAACCGVLMVGAFFTHLKRKDPPASMVITLILTGLAAYIAYRGFSVLL